MVRGKSYKSLPLPIKVFQEAYNITNEELTQEYKIYLEANRNRHHYGPRETMCMWYKAELISKD